MTAKELRSKSTEELQQELVALKDELFKLRFQHATNQLENPQRLGAVKRDIARVNTILREQELKAN
ncbi:MAG: 50S ribosomal protein L29 [Clostridiales bacterium]|jgi:large subunit ribosomal protein L29|nr:50S ribosomal protein L29 [Clostridiales bacterium]MBQ5966295.1 50S ribosomal protein L29 [Clostridiales bacterium]MBR2751587.1 50S ribosomal protein L29 [Clostridiales bacterium]MBR3058213.1 50S ribosomal protein L29 [Clostridiales bacterium]